MQTATSETESKSRDLSICVHHYTLRAPCPKGQGKARIRCQDLASSRPHCLLPLDPIFLARSKLPTRDLEIFYCLHA